MKNSILKLSALSLFASVSINVAANESLIQKPALTMEIESVLNANMAQLPQLKVEANQVELAKIKIAKNVPTLAATLKDKNEMAKSQKLSD